MGIPAIWLCTQNWGILNIVQFAFCLQELSEPTTLPCFLSFFIFSFASISVCQVSLKLLFKTFCWTDLLFILWSFSSSFADGLCFHIVLKRTWELHLTHLFCPLTACGFQNPCKKDTLDLLNSSEWADDYKQNYFKSIHVLIFNLHLLF